LLLLGLKYSHAQQTDYIFRHITANEGLINNRVITICQDKEGYMWIGTQAGLQRYDGIRFKNYLADVRDTSALQSDWISAIFEDSKKRLWIGTDQGGPYILNRVTRKFYNYNLHTTAKNKITGIWQFAEDKQGAIWIAGYKGTYKLNETTNQFENYNIALGFDKHDYPGSLTIDNDNNLWLNSFTGIKFYNPKERKLYSAAYNPTHNPLFDIKGLGGKMLLTGNDLWFTGYRIFYKYNILTKKINTFSFDKPFSKTQGPEIKKETIAGLFALQDGKIIVPLAGRGFAVYNPTKNNFYIVETDNTKPYTYHNLENSDGNVCTLQDKEKNIVIGNDAGINIYNPEKQFFKIHKNDLTNNNSFPQKVANDFMELPDGNILISYYNTNGGIVKADSNLQFKKHYLFNDKNSVNTGSNQIWNLFKDEKGIIWAPNQHNAILKFNVQHETISEFKDTIIKGPINTIQQDSEGVIWIGHWSKGLVKTTAELNNTKFYFQFLRSDPTHLKRVQTILLEKDKIWAGTNQNGLQLFDKKKEQFVAAYVPDEKNKTSISSNCVTDILRYNKHTLVLATLMGINIFDENNKTFKTITAKEGLPNNLVQAVMKDGFGNVWVACYNDGFCKINMNDFSITSYGINDGITDNAFTSKFYQLKNGNVLIGASESFISFNPAAFTAAPAPANVRITGLHVFEKEVMVDPLLNGHRPLQLSYKENSVRIEFASLTFWSPGCIQYFYKLDGVDKGWIAADKSHVAIYNQLKDGKYIFNIKCKNRDGVFCINTTQLKINISPPFWKTGWFISLILIFIVGLIYWFIKWREKNIKAIDAGKLKVQQLKLEALRSQMNPHFIFNSLNAIQECILTNKVDAAYEYLSKFSRLQRMVLNNSEKELIPLNDEIEMIALYLSLESLRFKKSFTYDINITGISDIDEIMIPSLITQPLVENAIWHGLGNKEGDKTLVIIYEEKNGLLFITIDDNGIGRQKAALIRKQKLGSSQFASKGTIILQQRLHVLSQHLKADIHLETIDKKDELDNATGTKVIIAFPSNLETI
jgi:ligand-binding sensor domain-containing protein